MTKYIFITGGVVSSLGKGITAASLGRILKSRGLKVLLQKFDPYINVDPGTMSPYQHGEVFVTDDGAETDLDLGHYERFLASPLMQGKIADHREVPFWARVNGVPFEGAIDRRVQRPDGAWILVDYKTGTPGGVEEYAVQITVYRHAAAQLLGQPVTPYLYFVDADRWVEVAVDEEQVFATIEQAVRGIEERSL